MELNTDRKKIDAKMAQGGERGWQKGFNYFKVLEFTKKRR